MYTTIDRESQVSNCDKRRRGHPGGGDLKVITPIPMGSLVGSAQFSGRSCVRELCPDCGKFPKYPPRVEPFSIQQAADEYVNAELMKHYYVPCQEELPFSEHAFHDSHRLYNSTVMRQAPPEMVHCYTSPMREPNPEQQSSYDSVPFRKKRAIPRRRRANEWKKALKAVKPCDPPKPISTEPSETKPTSPKIEKNTPVDKTAAGDDDKIANVTVKQIVLKSPKFIDDGKGDGPETDTPAKPATPKVQKILKVLPTAPTVQKVSIPANQMLPSTNSTIGQWRISDKNSVKSTEKVLTWMGKDTFYKNREPEPCTSNENRQLLKKSILSMAELSREEHLQQLHQCIRNYIEYLQAKNDVVETATPQSESSDANVVQVDADSLLNMLSHPMGADLNLSVKRSVTDAAINADGRLSQESIAHIMKLRNKEYGDICEKLKDFFEIVRVLDNVSGLSKKQSQVLR